MSNTRYAKPGSEPSDERYASDPLLTRGLKAGDVVRKCETLDDPNLIELAMFLQHISNQPGSLEKLTADLLDAFPDRLGTGSMIRYGLKSGDMYNAEQVRAVRSESPFDGDEFHFPLKGEMHSHEGSTSIRELLDDGPRPFESCSEWESRKNREEEEDKIYSEKLPSSYPVDKFIETCSAYFIRDVPDILYQFCIVPKFTAAQLHIDGFHDLRGALLEYLELWEKKVFQDLVITEVGGKVLEALNYSEDQHCLSLVEGFARTGKTFIADAWCKARPGRRRFVSLSEATSEKEFFREIAKALSATAGYGLKANELRERATGVLRARHLTLVIDEAHFLWPQRNLRDASPRRIEWVRASLANYGVSVAMIATHQFTRSQQQIEKYSHWSSEQFIGRLAFCAKLPPRLQRDDIEAVARYHLPEAGERTIKFLVSYVIASKKHLASIEHGVKAARHEAQKQGRKLVTYNDVMVGFNNTVIPTDANLAQAALAAETGAARHKRAKGKVYTTTLPQPAETISAPDLNRESGAALVTSDRAKRSSVHLSTA